MEEVAQSCGSVPVPAVREGSRQLGLDTSVELLTLPIRFQRAPCALLGSVEAILARAPP